MMISLPHFILVILWYCTSVYANSSLSCSSVGGLNNSLPCVEVSSCDGGVPTTFTVQSLSNGLTNGKSKMTGQACYTKDHLQFTFNTYNQTYYASPSRYSDCNDNVFLMDIVEVFIAPGTKDASITSYCYSEIDTNPYNQIFQSGIYAPNLNHSGVMNYLIPCEGSKIVHSTAIDSSAANSWQLTLAIPWQIINAPTGCPLAQDDEAAAVATSPAVGTIFRGNVYRINELSQVAATSSCSSSTCEFLAWSPTDVNPAAFHEPSKFGYWLIV